MKLTKQRLEQVIKEEVTEALAHFPDKVSISREEQERLLSVVNGAMAALHGVEDQFHHKLYKQVAAAYRIMLQEYGQ